jgi:tRNA A-37 threonylcarbamoyl transferase component Bud32
MPSNAPQGLCPKCLLLGVAAPTEPALQPERRLAPPPIDSVRAAFPQLEVLEMVGQGGMGAVFKARQPKLNRFVALKILPEELSRMPAFAERFTREAQMLARLHHPNIVTVHDFGQANGFFYLLMEYVEGVNLRQAMSTGRFSPEQALAIVPMICEALQFAHEEGVLHRDVKPENILLDTKGRVRLVDFGIAKLASMNASSEPGTGEQPSDITLTQTGAALGTPSYMAPEQQLDPATVDQRADIYSLGVVFYELLTGELPGSRLTRPSQRTPLDPRIDDVVMRAMARRKEQRFATAADVKTAVQALGTSAPSAPVPAVAEGHPVALSEWMAKGLLAGWVVLIGLILYELSYWRPLWLLHSQLQAPRAQLVLNVAGLAVLGWLVVWTWRRREWLLAPFLDRDRWYQASPSADAKTIEWLRVACLAFIGVFSLQCLWMLMSQVGLFTQGFASGQALLALSVLIPTGAILMPAAMAVLLIVILIRREIRRQHLAARQAPPSWMRRVALLFLVFAVVISCPMPQGDAPSTFIGFGGFAAVPALALVSRSRLWRAMALGVVGHLLFVSLSGIVLLGIMAVRGELPEAWWTRVGPVNAFTLGVFVQFVSMCVYGAELVALLLPSSAAAFGIPPRARQREAPAFSHA